MKILIPQSIYQTMIAHVQSELPLEACGLLVGKDNHISHIYLIENILHSPVEFEMNPQQQLKAMLDAEDQGLDLIGSFHSHPMGPQMPSQTDVSRAYYPELAQIIIALADRERPSVRAFTIIDELISELQIRVVSSEF